jgi:hypothetical protein
MTVDEKRFYRELKRDLKRRGNRQLRRYLKDVSTDPEEFRYGAKSSTPLNGMDNMNRQSRDYADGDD